VGLSILIPVFNYDVTALVKTLAGQLQQSGIPGEIILLDDGSENMFDNINRQLAANGQVKYFRNEKNEGRSPTRKKLASLAEYDLLLFLDCDSRIVHKDFIDVYWQEGQKDFDVISGGRIYSAVPPADCSRRLHWKYGSRRESKDTSAFQSNNFLVKKKWFEKLDFSWTLPGYGHEDTWWGIQFEQLGAKVSAIHNPVLHDALDDCAVYLQKAENALKNLLLLEKKIDTAILQKNVKIYRWFCRLRSTGMDGFFLSLEKILHPALLRNLRSCRPKLICFDGYRLGVLIRLSKKKKNQD
jgi:glycosyltransferase involved in cell wall biosynthesis